MNILNRIFIIIIILTSLRGIELQGGVRYHCASDSAKVMELVRSAAEGDNFGDRVVLAAKWMEGIPFAPGADNDSLATIRIRLDSLSQREFINYALAAAKTAVVMSPTVRDFERNLENISRKKGVDEGFPSQFLYGADWIVDNVYRGNLKELTEYIENGNYRTKTLDYVTRHPEEFPAMADPEVADKIMVAEMGFRSHRIPHLKKQTIGNKNVKELLQNGDIIIMNSNEPDFDIYDIGIVSFEQGEPTLLHIPRNVGAVTLDPYPLPRLFKVEGQYFYGFRWLRPLE